MAFAMQNVKLETNGSTWLLVGECTSSPGDADGTVTVGGNRVYQALFFDVSDTTPTTQPLPVKIVESITAPTSVITVNASNGITKGRFSIVFR